jgi:hypothetical protein
MIPDGICFVQTTTIRTAGMVIFSPFLNKTQKHGLRLRNIRKGCGKDEFPIFCREDGHGFGLNGRSIHHEENLVLADGTLGHHTFHCQVFVDHGADSEKMSYRPERRGANRSRRATRPC